MYGREVLIMLNADDSIIDVNEGFCKILGYERNNVIGEKVSLILKDDIIRDVKEESKVFMETLEGTIKIFDLNIKKLPEKKRCISLIDITESRCEDSRNVLSLKGLYENAKDIIYIREIDKRKKFIYLNNAVTKLLGYKKEDFYNEKLIIEDLIHPLDLKKLRGRVLSEKSINKSLEVRVKNKDGKYIWFEDICIPSYDDNGNLTLIKGISRCIQERKLAQNELERLIYSDSMTKLNNRKYFEDSIKKLKSKNLGIIVIDLDNLKETNDNFGHLIGDELILCAANIFKRIFKEDIKVRIGGDEFIIVIKEASLEIVKQKIKELEEEIKRYNKYSILKVSLSKGYSLYSKERDNIRKAIEEADYNMYKEKQKKKSLECEKKCTRNLKYSLNEE